MSPLLEQVDEVVRRAKTSGLKKIVNICVDEKSLEAGLKLAERYDWIYNTASTTPHDVEKEGDSFFPQVKEAAQAGKLIAIGETGLDYFYEHSPKQVQQKFFSLYLQLAKSCSLPLIFHCRDAFYDLFSQTDEVYRNCPAILHCFTGTLDEAKEGLKRGWMISFSGIITFKKSESLREVVKYVPLENILAETDSPYLAPQTKRGLTNEPAFIRETIEMIAQVKALSVEEVTQATSQNALKFFSFSKG
jgi:TatD DNase family protein